MWKQVTVKTFSNIYVFFFFNLTIKTGRGNPKTILKIEEDCLLCHRIIVSEVILVLPLATKTCAGVGSHLVNHIMSGEASDRKRTILGAWCSPSSRSGPLLKITHVVCERMWICLSVSNGGTVIFIHFYW